MSKPVIGLCVLVLLLSCGCFLQPKSPSSSQIQDPWTTSQSSHVQLQSQTLGTLPNSGLQLPVVSPDGKWIAFLDFQGESPPSPSSLFTGQGLEPVSLYIQSAQANAEPRILAESNIAWPSWSANSKKLLFISYSDSGQCELAIHDILTSTTRRLSIGGSTIIMPSLSPSGQHVAVVAFDSQSHRARLHVVNLSTGNIEYSCPAESSGAGQLQPQWTPDGQIIFVLNAEGQSHLVQWRPGESRLQRLAKIQMRATESGIYQAFAGLGRPLSPDGSRFAYYDTTEDRIVLLNLAEDQRIELPVGTRAGCWFDSGRFVAADQKKIRLFSVRGTMPALLMHGQGLPRGANAASKELLLCNRAAGGRDFNLVTIKILAVE